MSVILPVQSLM